MRALAYILNLAWCLAPVLGNVEKAIFLAPEAVLIPPQHPNLQDLNLETLSPAKWSLRIQLAASFPFTGATKGTESWFLLDGLSKHQRYEVRVCWAATVRFLSIV